MAKTFNNLIEFEVYLQNQLVIALDNTMEILLNKLRDIIESVVYGWVSIEASEPWMNGAGITSGNRTGEFYDSWEKTIPIIKGNLIESELFQNLSTLEFQRVGHNPMPFAHIDVDNLAQIIETGTGYNIGYADDVPRPFWNDFMNWVEMNIYTIFEQECNKVGIKGMITYK